MLLVKTLVLIALANFSPILLRKLLGQRCSMPVDGGLTLKDGYRLLGDSKTIRGVISALVLVSLVGGLLGFSLFFSAMIALLAMVGDLLSSFIKRRRGLMSSERAFGLDQLPESVLPLLFAFVVGVISFYQVLLGAVVFFCFAVWISPLLFWLGIRARPY